MQAPFQQACYNSRYVLTYVVCSAYIYIKNINTMFDNVQYVKIADKCEIGIKTGANIALKLLCTIELTHRIDTCRR